MSAIHETAVPSRLADLAAMRETPEFRAYLRVRDAVLAVREALPPSDASAYWHEELGNIDYLLDASPLVIRKLRHHAFHVTNRRPYDYRDKGDGKRESFEARLRALQALDTSGLAVPESPLLGGFGYEVDGALHNVDTLKFYEVLLGMERANLLDPYRAGERRVVWEIGAGWGGFAYQVKRLFPGTTYVITDFPELFLFSATYLLVHFPEARLHVCGAGAEVDPAEWGAFDFVFVPSELTAIVARARVDLAVNMVSFQEMTDAQVREYGRLAADAGCRALYSLNRERSPFNTELSGVSRVLGERFSLRENDLLDRDYTAATKKPPKPGKTQPREELAYRHLVATPKAGRGSIFSRITQALS
jgi:hypothetical protein